MRLLLAAGASGSEDLAAALIGAPTLSIVGVAHLDADVRGRLAEQGQMACAPDVAALLEQVDADAVAVAAEEVGAAAGIADSDTPTAIFLSSVNGALDADDQVSILAPSLHRSPHTLLRASLDTGRIGSPRFLRWTRWAPADSGELAGALIDELAAVLDLMGRPAVTAYAAGQTVGADGPDYVTTIVTFERGLTAVLDVGAAPAGGQPFDRAMLIGANGSIHADGRAAAALRLDDSRSTPLNLDGPFAGHIRAVEAFTRGESLDLGLATEAAAVQGAVLASMESGRAEAVVTSEG